MTWFKKMVGDFATESGEKPLLEYQQDGSNQYTLNKGIALFIGHYNSKRTVTFKPFLESYSLDFKYEDSDDIYKNEDGVMKQIKIKKSISYNLSLILPANSINEGNINLAKVEEFRKMVHSSVSTQTLRSDGHKFISANQFGVLLSNIVSNGLYNSKKDISSWSTFKKYAVFGYIDDLTIDHIPEYGYFDSLVSSKDKLTPKALKITFSLKVNIGSTKEHIGKYLYLPFDKEGKYYKKDTKYWPFGIVGFGSLGSDGRIGYSDNRNAYFNVINPKIGKDRGNKRRVEFELSLEKMTLNSTVDRGEKDTVGGDVFQDLHPKKPEHNQKVDLSLKMFAHSLNEAKSNMKKIQYLIRMINVNPDMVKEMKPKSNDSFTKEMYQVYWDEQARRGGPIWNEFYTKTGAFALFYVAGLISGSQADSNNALYWGEYKVLLSKILTGTDAERKERAKKVNQKVIESIKSYANKLALKGEGEISFSFKTQYPNTKVLISNLQNKSRNTNPTYNNVDTNGHDVVFSSFTVSPVLDLGFFEQNGLLYFKGYDISFSYELSSQDTSLKDSYGYTDNDQDYSRNANKFNLIGALDYDSIIKIT